MTKLIENKEEALNGEAIINLFPFGNNLKDEYITKLENELELGKEHLLRTMIEYMSEDDQVFETEVNIIKNLEFIRYLFPIPYVKGLINQGKFKTQTVDVNILYEYTQYVDVNEIHKSESEEPVMVINYPYASPGFFVLDGNHRVYEAYRGQQKTIEAFILPEGALLLLVPNGIFTTLYKIHKNLTAIGLYMLNEISIEQLKSKYSPIANEAWKI